MALSIEREMTDCDNRKLEAAAYRICKKYGIDTGEFGPVESIECAIEVADEPERTEMLRDWKRRVKRALGGYTAWGYGYVGHLVD